MVKIYLTVMGCALVIGAYFFGANVSTERCRANNLQNTLIENEQKQTQTIQQQRNINEKVFKTGLGDIRRILHDKYTIKE